MRFAAAVVAGVLLVCSLPLAARAETRADLVVTTTADDGPGSLRQAILDANAAFGPNTVRFAIPGSAPHVITVRSNLPAAVEPIVIDASTQPGYVDRPVAELRGARSLEDGLVLLGGFSTVRGLAIDGFGESGLVLRNKGTNVVEGCDVGTDTSGVNGTGNGYWGIYVETTDANRIGGTSQGAGNVVARNGADPDNGGGIFLSATTGTVVQGNFVGTDRTAHERIGNRGAGIRFGTASATVVGGVEAGAGNVVAYNDGAGIRTHSLTATSVLSNAIYENGESGRDGIRYDAALLNPKITFVGAEAGGTRVTGGILEPNVAGYPARVEIFRPDACDENGNGQGKTLLGSVDGAFDADGLFAFSTLVPVALRADETVVATVTALGHTSSGFTRCQADTHGCTLPLVTRIDALKSVRRGETTTIEAVASGTGPLSYLWTGGRFVPTDATSARATTAPVTDYTQYLVTVTGACGTATDSTYVFPCDGVPAIVEQPHDAETARGYPALFSVLVDPNELYTYQWYRGRSGDTSEPVPATSAVYSTPTLDVTTSYWVRLSNACGSIDSDTATATVLEPMTITSVKIKRDASGSSRIVAKGTNLSDDVYVSVDAFLNGDYVGFAGPASHNGAKLSLKGPLADGRSVDEMIPSGRSVRIVFGSVTRGSVTIEYTRP